MSLTPKPDAPRPADHGKCLARSVADALAEDPTLEAVTVDQARQTISVATLGKTDVPKLTERISASEPGSRSVTSTTRPDMSYST